MGMVQNMYSPAQSGYGYSAMGGYASPYAQPNAFTNAMPMMGGAAVLGNSGMFGQGGTITTTLSEIAQMVVGVVFSVLERLGLMSPQSGLQTLAGGMNGQAASVMSGRAGAAAKQQLHPYEIASDIAGYLDLADGIVDRVNDSGTVIGNALNSLGVDIGGTIGGYLKDGGQFIKRPIGSIIDTVGGYVGDGAGWLWDNVSSGAGWLMDKVGSGAGAIWDGVTSLFDGIF